MGMKPVKTTGGHHIEDHFVEITEMVPIGSKDK